MQEKTKDAIDKGLMKARYYGFYHATKSVSQDFLSVLEAIGKILDKETQAYIKHQADKVRAAYQD